MSGDGNHFGNRLLVARHASSSGPRIAHRAVRRAHGSVSNDCCSREAVASGATSIVVAGRQVGRYASAAASPRSHYCLHKGQCPGRCTSRESLVALEDAAQNVATHSSVPEENIIAGSAVTPLLEECPQRVQQVALFSCSGEDTHAQWYPTTRENILHRGPLHRS